MTDSQTKYQKLATEYAKLRAQLPVLKDAVIEEQRKAGDLQEAIEGKDQSIRKLEQEVDSLSFRNQQLSTRVEIFQRESDNVNSKTKKQKKGGAAPPVDPAHNAASSVLGEELQSKITENARLHTRLSEVEVRHTSQVEELRRKVSQLEVAAGEQQSVLDEKRNNHQQLIDKLQDDKVKLEVKLQRREKEWKEASQKSQSLQDELTEMESKLSKELESAKRVINEKIQFNDAEFETLNSLNLSGYNRAQQIKTKDLISQATSLVSECVQALLNFYSYSEQRVRLYPVDGSHEPLTPANKQYCQHLLENATHIRPIEQTIKAFSNTVSEESMTTLETATGLHEFATAFEKFCSYMSKILPYQSLSLEEECNAPACNIELQSSNRQLSSAYKQWQSAFAKLSTYVSMLSHQSSPNCDHPRSSQVQLFCLTSQAVAHTHQVLKGVARCYQMKLTLEHELPTVSEKLKVTNECALSALLSLVNVFDRLSSFFSSNLSVFTASVHNSPPTRAHPATTVFRQRAATYLASLQRPCPESVPQNIAVKNRKTLFSSTESRDSLNSQVVSLQERVTKLEQEKEHWMLESKLLQRKYEKECQKRSSAEERLQARTDVQAPSVPAVQHTDPEPETDTAEDPAPGGPTLETMLGKLTRTLSEEQDVNSREEFIKTHYSSKIAKLTTSIQVADSMALHFQAECRALSKQLAGSVRERDKQRTDLEATRETVSQLKDELQTTSRSYEDQLKTMTEHLAGMNDKLSSQTDEIDALKRASNNKVFKKGFLGKQK